MRVWLPSLQTTASEHLACCFIGHGADPLLPPDLVVGTGRDEVWSVPAAGMT